MAARPNGGAQVVDAPPSTADGVGPRDRGPAGASAPAPPSLNPLRHPVLSAVVGCIALAALSAAVLPTVPSYDPWAWIVWGREVFDPHLSFSIGGGPSWKPLPVIFTTVYGLFGGAAPTLWVITARAGGLLGLVAAWRLSARLVRPVAADAPESACGVAQVIAGLVAVLGVMLTQDWFYYMFRGTSEPTLIATWLWAIDRLLERKHSQAFVIGIAGALIRPEFWPFVGVLGVWLWLREPRLRLLVVGGFAAIPFFWFVVAGIGGDLLNAAHHAHQYNGHLGRYPVLEAFRRSFDLQVAPVVVAALVAVVWTWVRERDRDVLALAAAAVLWIALVVAMVIAGYPGLERFFLPAAAILCVLAGLGVARVALFAGAHLGAGGRAALVAGAVGVVLIAVSIPFASSRISIARAQKTTADQAVTILDQLSNAVAVVGGHDRVFPCRSSFVAVNHSVQTALAWKLHVTLGRVGTAMRHSGLDFIGPHNTITGGLARVNPKLTRRVQIAQVGVWRVVRMTVPGHSTRCVGS
jgi:hypothetical protein